MRGLLESVSEGSSAPSTVLVASVLAVVAVVIIVPTLLLCGDCFGDPDPIKNRPQQNFGDTQTQQWPQQQHYPQPGTAAPPPLPTRPPAGQPYGQGGGHYPQPSPYQQPPRPPGPPNYPSQQPYHQPPPPHNLGHHSQPTPPGYQHPRPPAPGPAHHSTPQPSPVPTGPRPGPPPPMPPSDGVLRPRDGSLDAVVEVLHHMCSTMKGSVRPGKNIIEKSIRKGINAVIADASTNYAVDETILFFPEHAIMQRHMKLYNVLNLKDSMPLVSLDTDVFEHTDNGRTAVLPAAIFVNRVRTLDSVVKSFTTPQEKQQELFGIWQQLAKLLRMFHQRGWFLRDVTYDNVVLVRMGVSEGWTLLEFGNASKERRGVAKSTIPPRTVTPELAEQMLRPTDEKVHLSPAYDMWQLGILVYEVMTGESYWPQKMRDADVLRTMENPNRLLPHEQRPIGLDLVQKVMVKLMHRDPAQRFSSTELIKRLETDLATAGAVTMNPGEAHEEGDIVMES